MEPRTGVALRSPGPIWARRFSSLGLEAHHPRLPDFSGGRGARRLPCGRAQANGLRREGSASGGSVRGGNPSSSGNVEPRACPLIELGPSSEAAMVLAFLQAERESPRFSWAIDGDSSGLLDGANLDDPEENAARARMLGYRGFQQRDFLFRGFPADVQWRRVELEAAD